MNVVRCVLHEPSDAAYKMLSFFFFFSEEG